MGDVYHQYPALLSGTTNLHCGSASAVRQHPSTSKVLKAKQPSQSFSILLTIYNGRCCCWWWYRVRVCRGWVVLLTMSVSSRPTSNVVDTTRPSPWPVPESRATIFPKSDGIFTCATRVWDREVYVGTVRCARSRSPTDGTDLKGGPEE